MQLLVVRHGIAVEQDEWAREHSDDTERPLTAEGKKKMKECAKRLRAIVPRVDVVATSPLTRALHTAAILAKIYAKGEPVIVDALSPGHHAPALPARLPLHGTQRTGTILGQLPGPSATVST